jgi:integrase
VSPNEVGRHSAASLLPDAGLPLPQIAEILGHNSTRTLEVYYRHQVRPSLNAHVAVMEQIFAPR